MVVSPAVGCLLDIAAIETGLIVPLPFLLTLPSVGRAVAASRWSPIAWAAATAIGIGGTASAWLHVASDHRLAVLCWAPLYQLIVYTAALRIFRHSLHRFPRFAVWDLFTEGLFWDQFFMVGVLLISILPCGLVAGSRWAAGI